MSATSIRSLIPLIVVDSVPRSIEFYERIGFSAAGSFTPPGAAEPGWASLVSESAELMIGKADSAGEPGRKTIFLYLYCDDVEAKRSELAAAGVAVGDIARPFYNPKGEFEIADPDGYRILISHT